MVTAATSAWISTSGTFYPVAYASHWDFAVRQLAILTPDVDYSMHGYPVGDLEKRGWLHISNEDTASLRFGGISIVAPRHVNNAQVDALYDWATAHDEAGNADWRRAILRWISRLDTD